MTARLRTVSAIFSGRDHGTSPSDDEDWTNRAACIEHGLLFDMAYDYEPKKGKRRVPPAVTEAKAVCRRCPVIAECLAEVLERPSAYGIFAGMTADERAKYARVRRGRR